MLKNLERLPVKVKMALLSMLDDYYSLEKSHTVIVMPFFGLLHTSGNEAKPILNYVDINILDIMKSHFKDVFVYAGDNKFLQYYGLDLNVAQFLADEQNILSRIVNKTTNFDRISDKHTEILRLYQGFINNFDEMKQLYPLPYKTAFDVSSPSDLIDFIKKVDKKIKSEDKFAKICLICPLSYLTNYPRDVYNSIKTVVDELGVMLYFSQNQSDGNLYSAFSHLNYNGLFNEKLIQSIQDFANQYCDDVSKEAYKKLNVEQVYQSILKGEFGKSEKETIDKIEQINTNQIYASAHIIQKEKG